MPETLAELLEINQQLRQQHVEMETLFEQEKAELATLFEAEKTKLKSSFEQQIELLRQQVALLRHQLYGRKSEQLRLQLEAAGQQSLLSGLPPEEDEETADEAEPLETVTIGPHERRKRGRKPIPDDIPREEIIHDIPEEDKVCDCGCAKTVIGRETSKELDYIPARFKVLVHVRPKYACRSCEGVEDSGPAVSIAPMPERIIPRSFASPGLLAQIITAKFVDSLPFYRQEKQFLRLRLELSRATMCNWAVKVALRCEPLLELMLEQMRAGPVIQIDETSFLVMNEEGRSNKTKSQMWVMRGGDPDHPMVLYHYDPSRSGDVAARLLKDYAGYVQSDGFSGYSFLDKELCPAKPVACMAHIRRKFMDVVKAGGKGKKKGQAHDAIQLIKNLYEIERQARQQQLTVEQIVELRQEKSRPQMDRFHKWLTDRVDKTPPRGLLGQAIAYALKMWPRMKRYLENGHLQIDNNRVENEIRPFAVGRKNWLLNASPDGAAASATLYSLVQSARANGLEPYWYLRHLFQLLPTAGTEDDLRRLLPSSLSPETIAPTQPVGGGVD